MRTRGELELELEWCECVNAYATDTRIRTGAVLDSSSHWHGVPPTHKVLPFQIFHSLLQLQPRSSALSESEGVCSPLCASLPGTSSPAVYSTHNQGESES